MNIIGIQYDEGRVAELQRDLADIPHGIERVLTRAVNKVAVAARTRVLRMVTEEINVRQSDIRQRNIKLRKASFDQLYAAISITGRRIPLRKFGARQTRRGVSYAIRRGGRTEMRHAFLAEMKTGHRGVFRRKDKAPRLPIQEKYGPSVPQVVEDSQDMVSGAFDDEMDSHLEREVDTQVGLVIERYRRV
jgi:hypothetical protein